MLEQVLIEADEQVTLGLDPTSAAWDVYFVT
jgi:hypothetical protein